MTGELKAEIIEVGTPIEVGDKKTRIQSIIVKVPGYHDGFEKIGKDEFWKLDVIGDNIEKLQLSSTLEGKRAKCKVYINSSLVINKDQTNSYFINAVLASYELATVAA